MNRVGRSTSLFLSASDVKAADNMGPLVGDLLPQRWALLESSGAFTLKRQHANQAQQWLSFHFPLCSPISLYVCRHNTPGTWERNGGKDLRSSIFLVDALASIHVHPCRSRQGGAPDIHRNSFNDILSCWLFLGRYLMLSSHSLLQN